MTLRLFRYWDKIKTRGNLLKPLDRKFLMLVMTWALEIMVPCDSVGLDNRHGWISREVRDNVLYEYTSRAHMPIPPTRLPHVRPYMHACIRTLNSQIHITLLPSVGAQLSMGLTPLPTLSTVPLNSRPGTNPPLGVAL